MEPKTQTKPAVRNINKPAYVIFLVAGIYFMIVGKFTEASTFGGLALMFDPFNIETPFAKRPLYQRVWLIVHLTVTLGAIVLTLMGK